MISLINHYINSKYNKDDDMIFTYICSGIFDLSIIAAIFEVIEKL